MKKEFIQKKRKKHHGERKSEMGKIQIDPKKVE